MSQAFLNGLRKELNFTLTANGAVAVNTTGNATVDLFGSIGALRTTREHDIVEKFKRAFYEDAFIATKMLFYARDIRGGLGERRTFRVILKWLAEEYPEIVELNLDNIVEFGRYDDLFELFGTKTEQDMITYVKDQFDKDITEEYPSLLAKWMPSENASSETTKARARKFIRAFGMTPKEYRTTLSALRTKLRIIEKKISSNDWNIEYEKVPSKAMMQYRKAFLRHDEDGFNEYMKSLSNGEAKVHADTLFPYDIVKKILKEERYGYYYTAQNMKEDFKKLYNAQWEALPNYIPELNEDTIVVADTSRSMTCNDYTPLAAALSLAIYFAEHNKGAYKNKFITFSSRPQLIELKGNNLVEKLSSFRSIVEDTNIEAVFNLILDTAINNGLKQEELPGSIIIVSDMQFNSCARTTTVKRETLIETMEKRFAEKGYKLPKLIFWDVNHQSNFPMEMKNGIQFVSGYSLATFQAILEGKFLSAIELVMLALNKPRYDCIKMP